MPEKPKRNLIREACDRAVTIFMIRYLERKARREMIWAQDLLFPLRADDGAADGPEAVL